MIKKEIIEFNNMVLEKSNLSLGYIESRRTEEFKEKGNEEIIAPTNEIEVNIRIGNGQKLDLNKHVILGSTLLFGIFDGYIDNKYPQLYGSTSFRKKYDELPENNNIDIVQKFFYRIYKLLRNTVVHNAEAISISDEHSTINYEYHGTQYKLSTPNLTLINLYTATMLLMNEDIEEKRGEDFIEGLLAWYYVEIKSNIIFNDDINGSKELEGDILLINPEREIVTNPKYEVEGREITIENAKSKYGMHILRDFLIEVETKYYLVPQECLSNGIIKTLDLYKWKVNENDYK